MKRLNPKTGEPFKRGEIREDGKVFYGYNSCQKTKSQFFYEKWATKASFIKLLKYSKNYDAERKSTKAGQIHRACCNIKSRAKTNNIDFDLTDEFLLSIAPERCPVLDVELAWGSSNVKAKPNSPSLDSIDPSKGYIKGNVQWMSQKANTMKNNAQICELKKFASWINKTF